MSRKSELVKLSEAYNEVVVNELSISPAAETTNMVPSTTAPTTLKISDTAKPENCEDMSDVSNDESDANMAKNELYKLHKGAKELYNIIHEGENLEPWVFSKITLAASYIESVKNYLEYNKCKKEGEFNTEQDAHEFKIVSRIRDMLHGESKEVLESVLRQAIFNLEAINAINEDKKLNSPSTTN